MLLMKMERPKVSMREDQRQKRVKSVERKEPISRVTAEHEQRAVSDIDDPHDTEDEGHA
jgi:hypothetical protein